MSQPINMALYRLLLKVGASESEAEDAARIDASDLVTKADLAELKADLQKFMLQLMLQLMLGMTAIFSIIVAIIAALMRMFPGSP